VGWVFLQGGRSLRLNPGYEPELHLRSPHPADLVAYPPPKPPKADTVLKALLAESLQKADSTRQPGKAVKKKKAGEAMNPKALITNPDDDGRFALDPFFEALEKLEQHKRDSAQTLVRVAHYGDSQIEGDRITVFLRHNLQRRFGGKGVGYVPVFEAANHHSLKMRHSENWKRSSIFLEKQKGGDYGAAGVVFRYPAATAKEEKAGKHAEAYVGYDADLKRIGYDRVNLLWGGAAGSARVQVAVADSVIWQDSIVADGGFHISPLGVPAGSEKVDVWFETPHGPSPDVYGLQLDGARGLQVDNYALRGHSGGGLLAIDADYFAAQVRALNTRLIVVQYGGNIVPYDKDDFKWYEDAMYKILMRLRAVAPDAAILVIGVGDMARKVGEAYESYPTVPKIRDAEKNAAKRAKCAFWDLYDVMGGEGSIIAWVNNDPPLAAQDYAHFDYPGQKLIGDLLYKALMHEYALYLKRMQTLRAQDVSPQRN
jgi:hypothetical protein